MVSRDLVPIARGCAGARSTGKPLQIAVDDVAGTIEATQTCAAILQVFRPIACGVTLLLLALVQLRPMIERLHRLRLGAEIA